MSEFKLKTPVAFIIFNRPDTTQKVFERIRKAKPPKLFVIADGPRLDKPEDAQKCEAARAIIDQIDWDCEVLKNYSDINMGCKWRPASGITWVFDHVEEAIILEDDCLPNHAFFRFCEEMLGKYRYDNRIMSISGTNYQFGRSRNQDSYYFSKYFHGWGWASWRRAWKFFDIEMKLWPVLRNEGWLKDIFFDSRAERYWENIFDVLYNKKINSAWDYMFSLACFSQNGLTIIPHINLVSNIGHGSDSTHTADSFSRFANMSTSPMQFPLQHPAFMIRNDQADRYIQANNYGCPSLMQRIQNRLKRVSMAKCIREDAAKIKNL
jgi:hypothetical protein